MAIHLPNRQLFIDGEWRETVLKKRIPVINPATEQIIGQFTHSVYIRMCVFCWVKTFIYVTNEFFSCFKFVGSSYFSCSVILNLIKDLQP